MLRRLLFVYVIVVFLPASSFALGFFNISSASIARLSAHTYRLRVVIDFGADSYLTPTPESPIGSDDPYLNSFQYTLLGFNQRNIFGPGVVTEFGGFNLAGDWHWGGHFPYWPVTGPLEFGYDFDFNGTQRSWGLTYSSGLVWNLVNYAPIDPEVGYSPYAGSYFEYFGGSVNLAGVPEPSTFTLLSLSLILAYPACKLSSKNSSRRESQHSVTT